MREAMVIVAVIVSFLHSVRSTRLLLLLFDQLRLPMLQRHLRDQKVEISFCICRFLQKCVLVDVGYAGANMLNIRFHILSIFLTLLL